MRVVGYLLLALLALYFLVVKPYLVARGVQIEVRGLSISAEEGLTVKSFLLYLPSGYKVMHLYVEGLKIKPWSLKADSFHFLEVSSSPPSDRPFDYDFGRLVELAGRTHLKVDRLYVSVNYLPKGQSLTIFAGGLELKGGVLSAREKARAYWMKGQSQHVLEVFLQRAQAKGRDFILEKAYVNSNLYSFELEGVWKGRQGAFRARGYIKPIEGRHHYLGKMAVNMSGSLSYTYLTADFSGTVEELHIKGRKSFTDLSLQGSYKWKWRKENRLTAFLRKDVTGALIDYSLSEERIRAEFGSFPVDDGLLGVSYGLFALADGYVDMDLKRRTIRLQAFAPVAFWQGLKLGGVSLLLTSDYSRELAGGLEISVSEPFMLSLKGNFLRRDFTGSLSLVGYNLSRDGLSALVSYGGSVRLSAGVVFSEGRGTLRGLSVRNLHVGDADYGLYLEGERYRISLRGRGYNLVGGGSVKEKSFSGSLRLEDFNFSYGGFDVRSAKGNALLEFLNQKLSVSGRMDADVHRENLSSHLFFSFSAQAEGNRLQGRARGELRGTRIFHLSYEKGSFEAGFEKGRLNFSFELENRIRGEGYYSYEDGSYYLQGYASHSQDQLSVAFDYYLKGKGRDLISELKGKGIYAGYSFPLFARFSLEGDRLEGFLKGFHVRHGLLGVRFPEVRIEGRVEQGRIVASPLLVEVGEQVVSSVQFQEGEYRGKTFRLRARAQGAVEGFLEMGYEGGIRLFSEGVADLRRLSSVFRSRLLAEAEGRLTYSFSYSESVNLRARAGAITVRSRYIALPLSGSLELTFDRGRLSGSVRLAGNQKASISASFVGDGKSGRVNFELSQLPVLYRNESMRGSFLLSGKGSAQTDYRNLNLSGTFYMSGSMSLQKVAGSSGSAPEDYKRVKLDLSVLSSEPLRINLPEGFLYADISAKIRGTLYEPDYRVDAYLKGGALTYFEREFFVRRGEVSLSKKDSRMDLTLSTPAPDYNIIIDLKGNPQYPKAVVRSEPPRDTREVLTYLVLGGSHTEGLIPVAGALVSQIPQLNALIKGARDVTGLDVKVQISPVVSSTGEVGVSATISKEISQKVVLEHRQSTVKDPKETYTGAEVRLVPGTSLGGRYYSDKTQEVRFRIRKKFDF